MITSQFRSSIEYLTSTYTILIIEIDKTGNPLIWQPGPVQP